MPSIWDHDLWQEIYDVQEPLTKSVLVNLYRLILDMHNSDVLAQKIAAQVNADKKIAFTWAQKLGGGILGAIMATDAFVHIFHL